MVTALPCDGYKFWIAMVAMHTGVRGGELCQLQPSDVRSVDGVRCFDINDDGGKSLKTESSNRLATVHSMLLSRGTPNPVLGVLAICAKHKSSSLKRLARNYLSGPIKYLWFK